MMITTTRTPFQFPHSTLPYPSDALFNRLNAHAPTSCLERLKTSVVKFFTHAYADFRMFWRAFSTLQMTSNSTEINQHIEDVSQLKRLLLSSERDRQIPVARFGQLSPKTKSLFFYVNPSYMNLFALETHPAKIEDIKQEILRECDRVISNQHRILLINSITSTIFKGRQAVPPQSHTGVSTAVIAGSILIEGVDIGIPDTIEYDAEAIPQNIVNKGAEINRLIDDFENLDNPPEIPQDWKCSISMDLMAIPVFDASHPALQEHLNTLREDLQNPVKAKEALEHSRGLRHTMDSSSLETHFVNGNGHHWRPKVQCPSCRHPEQGDIDRRFLRIDTKLQDDTLTFLKNALGRN